MRNHLKLGPALCAWFLPEHRPHDRLQPELQLTNFANSSHRLLSLLATCHAPPLGTPISRYHCNSSSRLPGLVYRLAMSEVKLCDPCQKLLGRHPELSILTGQLDLEEAPFWDHHLDSVSLVEALQLPCSLCTLVWGDPKTTPGKRQGGTSYQITSMGEHDHTNARIIFFHYDEFLRNRVIAFVPLLGSLNSFLS